MAVRCIASSRTPSRHLPVHVCVVAALGIFASAQAQTIIPKLDQEGRKGDMARIAKEKAEARFNAADEDKDGKLSREEVTRHFPYIAENFDRYDSNHDGSLSWEEFVGHNRWPK